MAQAQIDSSTLAKQVDARNVESDGAVAAITRANEQVQSLGNVRAQATVDAATAKTVVDSAKETGEMRAEQASRKAAAALGTNPDEASYLIEQLGQEVNQRYQEAAAKRKAYFEAKNTDFFSDPLAYIATNFLGGATKLENQYSEAAMNYNAASSHLEEINNLTQTSAKTQAAIIESKTAASVQASAEVTAQTAAAQAAGIKQQNLLYNIEALKTINTINKESLDRLFSLNSAVINEKHLAIAQEHLKLTAAQVELGLEERKDRIEQKKADRAELEMLGDSVNKGRAMLNLAPIPAARAFQMMKLGGEAGKVIEHQYTMGAIESETGHSIIADNAGKAARIINSTQAPLSAVAAPIKTLLSDAYKDTIMSKKAFDKKDPNQVDAMTTATAKAMAATMAANIKVGDATNIYQAPDMQTLASIPAVKETALFKKVLAPLVETSSLTETNPQLIFDTARTAIQNKTLTFEEAREGITTLFKAATAKNNAAKDYFRYGLLPQESKYTTNLEVPEFRYTDTASPSRVTIDVANPTQVGNALSKNLMFSKRTTGSK